MIACISSSISVDCQTINSIVARPFIHSSVDGALGCFHFGAINNAAVNIDLHVSEGHVFISLWWDFILRVHWLISPFLGP